MNFTQVFIYRHPHPIRNAIMPKLLYVTLHLVFIWIPSVKAFLYMYFLYRTDLMGTAAAPFLLFSTINSVFILIVWYGIRVEPILEASQEGLEDEFRWIKER